MIFHSFLFVYQRVYDTPSKYPRVPRHQPVVTNPCIIELVIIHICSSILDGLFDRLNNLNATATTLVLLEPYTRSK